MLLTEAREKAIQVYENANIFTVKAIREGIKPLIDMTGEVTSPMCGAKMIWRNENVT